MQVGVPCGFALAIWRARGRAGAVAGGALPLHQGPSGGAAGPASPSEPVKAVVKEESAPTPKQEVATNSTTTTSAVGVKKVITKSISCVKGKIVRKISGSNPKCPSGFKKK